MPLMQKYFISADELLRDSFTLAEKIYQTGFRPDVVIGVWRGGTPVAIAIQEYLGFVGVPTKHAPIKASSYRGINDQSETIEIECFDAVSALFERNTQVLLVDDVFDSGRTLSALVKLICQQTNVNNQGNIKTATPWYKPKNNRTDSSPDFYLHETDRWLVFPHEINGLTIDEIKLRKPEVADRLP